jgi:hypothetical protein
VYTTCNGNIIIAETVLKCNYIISKIFCSYNQPTKPKIVTIERFPFETKSNKSPNSTLKPEVIP